MRMLLHVTGDAAADHDECVNDEDYDDDQDSDIDDDDDEINSWYAPYPKKFIS